MEAIVLLMVVGLAFGAVVIARMSSSSEALRRRIDELDDAARREANAARTAFWQLEQRVVKLEQQLHELVAERTTHEIEEHSSEASTLPPTPTPETPRPEPERVAPTLSESSISGSDFAWPTLEAGSRVRPRPPLAEGRAHVAEPPLSQPPRNDDEPSPSSAAADTQIGNGDLPPPRVSWEQWLGVRGAAALGAIVTVIAALYFFEYGIEHGLITPALRVITGFSTGTLLVVVADLVVRPRHKVLASWLTGAGIAVLYVATWATTALYQFVGTEVGFLVMCAVTALCCALATLRGSLPIAGLGLIGGFATPALLSSGQDRPVALFSYLFVLDAALLWVARRRDWASLAAFSLLGTVGYETSWIVARMGPERVALGLAILTVFGGLFSVFTGSDGPRRRVWTTLRVAGLCVPLLIGFGLSLEPHAASSVFLFGPFGLVIAVGAAWAAHRDGVRWLAPVASLGSFVTLVAWALTRTALDSAEWPWVASVLALAVVPVLPRVVPRGLASLPLWSAFSAPVALSAAAIGCAASAWPFEAAALCAGALVLAVSVRRSGRHVVVAAALAVVALLVVREARATPAEIQPFEGILLGFALTLAAVDRGAQRGRPIRGLSGAAYAVAVGVLLHWLWSEPHPLSATWASAALVVAVALCTAASARLGGIQHAGVLVVSTVVLLAAFARVIPNRELAVLGLACSALTLLIVSATPFVARRLRDDVFAWRAAAAAPLILFPVALEAYRVLFGRGTEGVAAVVPALACGAILVGILRIGPREVTVRRTATIWAAACSTALATAAIPLQLDREWITIGWALEAVALLLLWRRFNHAGLSYWALGLLAAVSVRLVGNPAVTSYHRESALPLLNWVSYTYLIPAACLVLAWHLFRDLEMERRRSWELGVLPKDSPRLSQGCAAAAVVVVFAWINLSVVSWYAPGHRLVFSLENEWARDLTMSIAWAAYALVLLGIGMWRGSLALRFTSLGLIFGTGGKVFFYDLSHLADLYRVASLLGLGASLVAISVAYQRLVFRRDLR